MHKISSMEMVKGTVLVRALSNCEKQLKVLYFVYFSCLKPVIIPF